MSYKSEEIKEGIKIHLIKNKKFKTNLIELNITTKISKNDVTKNALIPMILKRGTNNIKTQDKIYEKLEEMYGSQIEYKIEKINQFHILKFNIQTLNDSFVKENSNLLKDAINLILDITFNPLLENGGFKKEYVILEKKRLADIIKSKINNKDKYAFDRCIEEMHKNKPYGIYKYGYLDQIKKIDKKNIYKHYLKLIQNAKIDIYISGDINKKEIINIIKNNSNILKLIPRYFENGFDIIKDNQKTKDKDAIKIIKEKQDVIQGKLVIGIDLPEFSKSSEYVIQLYNTMLGASPNSKLFKIVREKNNLAYTINSRYIKSTNNIYIFCGIDINNYEKTLKLIKEQLLEMQKGNFINEELKNAKKYIISNIKAIKDNQDLEIIKYMMQELENKQIELTEYIKKINNVKKKEIIELSKKIKINTIYFLNN